MTEAASKAWEETAGGLRVFVRLTPKAARDEIGGLGRLSDGRAVVLSRVRAIPDKDEANKAVCALFSRALKLPKSAVRLESGATARLKTLGIDGDATTLAARLTTLCVPKTVV